MVGWFGHGGALILRRGSRLGSTWLEATTLWPSSKMVAHTITCGVGDDCRSRTDDLRRWTVATTASVALKAASPVAAATSDVPTDVPQLDAYPVDVSSARDRCALQRCSKMLCLTVLQSSIEQDPRPTIFLSLFSELNRFHRAGSARPMNLLSNCSTSFRCRKRARKNARPSKRRIDRCMSSRPASPTCRRRELRRASRAARHIPWTHWASAAAPSRKLGMHRARSRTSRAMLASCSRHKSNAKIASQVVNFFVTVFSAIAWGFDATAPPFAIATIREQSVGSCMNRCAPSPDRALDMQ